MPASASPAPPSWRARRFDRDASDGLRLTLAGVAAFLALGPFAVLAALVVGGWGPLRSADVSVTGALHTYAAGHPGWVRLMAGVSAAFAPNPLRAATALLAVWLLARGRRRAALWVAVTMTAGGLLGGLLKLLAQRRRPDLPHPVAHAGGYAFPSGHALTAGLAAGVFLVVLLPATRGRPVRRALLCTAAVTLAAVTGVSRVALGVHWSSDVVAGWLLAVAALAGTAAACAFWRPTAVTCTGRRPDRR
ncbi:phosphatase PAP2 family protein [Krasilnikovia sp. MM14-A1259]|uniref:phosphatase PAP2 family protein n=1 Tax=Krasilnikovia sp. MM14-A1259 TaxID=3373539 RepID=UPI0037F6F422